MTNILLTCRAYAQLRFFCHIVGDVIIVLFVINPLVCLLQHRAVIGAAGADFSHSVPTLPFSCFEVFQLDVFSIASGINTNEDVKTMFYTVHSRGDQSPHVVVNAMLLVFKTNAIVCSVIIVV